MFREVILLNQMLKEKSLPAEKSRSGAKNLVKVIELSSPSDRSDLLKSNQAVEVILWNSEGCTAAESALHFQWVFYVKRADSGESIHSPARHRQTGYTFGLERGHELSGDGASVVSRSACGTLGFE